jgi:LysR family transcriptional regulator, hydrogen peroxide-inducible genes activator
MEMQQIRYFVALCDELNFTRAAQRCKVAQPSLTIAIKALEEEFGGQLFHRKPRVALTQLGDALRSTLQEIMIQVEIARATAKAFTTHEQPQLNLEPRAFVRSAINGQRQLEV